MQREPGFKSQQPGSQAQAFNLYPIQLSSMTLILEVFLAFGATQFHLIYHFFVAVLMYSGGMDSAPKAGRFIFVTYLDTWI